MLVPGWLRRGAPLDQWWHRSARNRIVFGAGVIGAFCFVAALFDGEGVVSALGDGLAGCVLMLLALLVVAGWRRLRGRAPLA